MARFDVRAALRKTPLDLRPLTNVEQEIRAVATSVPSDCDIARMLVESGDFDFPITGFGTVCTAAPIYSRAPRRLDTIPKLTTTASV